MKLRELSPSAVLPEAADGFPPLFPLLGAALGESRRFFGDSHPWRGFFNDTSGVLRGNRGSGRDEEDRRSLQQRSTTA